MKYISIAILLICCNPRDEKRQVLVQDSVVEAASSMKKIYKVNKVACFFSSQTKRDTFSLELTGEYFTKGKIIFRIVSSQSEVIYEDQFESMALYGFGPDVADPHPDSITIQNHLLRRFDNFFDSTNFLRPAIQENVTYDKSYNDIIPEIEWDEIKSNPSSIGFSFILWEESIAYITYLKRKKKAVIYHVCC